MADTYDVVVLGTGNAGMGAAGVARAAGGSVAMVECWDVGGTCPIRGCVPKKVLVAAAQTLHQIELAKEHHIEVGPARLDWGKLIDREQGFVDGVPDMFRSSLEGREITLLEGEASFADRAAVKVNGDVLNAGKIVVATGSRPRSLPIPGFEHTITSDDILVMRELPESLVFIGGGVIALEFSHIFARAGVDVTILEMAPRVLPHLDPDLVAVIEKESRRIGIDLRNNVKVEAIEQQGDGFAVRYRQGDETRTVAADKVANGAGRVADVERLDLDAGGIEHDGSTIMVDDYLRSVSNTDVFVAGDALTGSAQLSPVATYEGRIAGHNLANDQMRKADYWGIPACVYTVPAAATVGMTEAEAADRGVKFEAKVNDMSTWRSSMTHAETASWAKVLVEDGSKRILGAHIMGHGAEEIIHIFAMAMTHGINAEVLGSTVYAYPTFASDIKFLI